MPAAHKPTDPPLSLPPPPRAAYHHGEASLGATIVGLAQDFVGSNNINYLVPQGGWQAAGIWCRRVGGIHGCWQGRQCPGAMDVGC